MPCNKNKELRKSHDGKLKKKNLRALFQSNGVGMKHFQRIFFCV